MRPIIKICFFNQQVQQYQNMSKSSLNSLQNQLQAIYRRHKSESKRTKTQYNIEFANVLSRKLKEMLSEIKDSALVQKTKNKCSKSRKQLQHEAKKKSQGNFSRQKKLPPNANNKLRIANFGINLKNKFGPKDSLIQQKYKQYSHNRKRIPTSAQKNYEKDKDYSQNSSKNKLRTNSQLSQLPIESKDKGQVQNSSNDEQDEIKQKASALNRFLFGNNQKEKNNQELKKRMQTQQNVIINERTSTTKKAVANKLNLSQDKSKYAQNKKKGK